MTIIQKKMDEMLQSITIKDFLHTQMYHELSDSTITIDL